MSIRVVRRSVFALLAAFIVTVACPKDPPVPVVTTITVSPTTRAFTALTQTQVFTAAVMDQNGNVMTGQPVVWATSSGTVATVSAGGLVTAQSVGSATITATIGTVVGSATVTVTQVPASLNKFDGDAQSAPVGAQLAIPIVVRVLDAAGLPIPAVAVGFAITTGGGTVGTPSTTTNALGQASSTWTLGLNTGPQTLTASSPGLTLPPFTATALAAPPDTVIRQTADGQSVPAGTPITPAPAVLVRDQFNNPVANIGVTFAVTGGGGQLTGATQFTNGSGIATVGSWIAGNAGPQQLTATVTGTGIGGNPIAFAATSLAPGAPASVVVSSGNNQTGLATYPLNTRPAALVRDATNNPVQNATVTFAVTAGGGSVTGGTATTDLLGVARVGSWSVNLGVNTMTGSVAGVATPATFNATGDSSRFKIDVRYSLGSNPTVTQIAAFDSAAARWQRTIFGDQTDVNGVTVTPASCGNAGLPATTENIDDVLIFAILVPIDGPGGVLGSAGPCSIRTSNSLTVFGLMRFDTADLLTLEQNGILDEVILHEMGHVLGLGTLWEIKGLLVAKDQPGTSFSGAAARVAFDEIGGTGFTGVKVPVEDCVAGVPPSCGGGTRNGHWREFVFGNELMTGYIDNPNPLSVVTAAQFGDLGYQINLGASDAFTVSFPLLALRAVGKGVYLGNDLLRAPIEVVDQTGRVVRTILPR